MCQKAYTATNNQQWLFQRISGQRIRFQARSSTASNQCVAAGAGALLTNGRNVQQRSYVYDSNYLDEWHFLGGSALIVPEGQENNNWCWAACCQMMLQTIGENGWTQYDLVSIVEDPFVYNPWYPDYEEELRTYEQLREHNDENNSQYYWKWQEVVTYNVGTLSDDTVLYNSNF